MLSTARSWPPPSWSWPLPRPSRTALPSARRSLAPKPRPPGGYRPRRHRPERRARRRLLRLRERGLDQEHRDPRRPQLVGHERRAHRADRPADGRPDRRGGEDRGPAGSDARKVGDYYASFMDEAGDRGEGARALEADPRSDRGDRGRAGLARVLGGTLRADVDVLNNTNLYTDNLFGLWVAQDLDDPTPLLAVPAAGRARHARPRLLPRPLAADGGDPGPVPGPRRRGAEARRRRRGEAQGRADRRARTPDRPGAREPRGFGRRAQGQQPLDARRTSRAARPASTGRRSSRPRASKARTTSWSGSRAR